jgi:hypothetical protein
VPGNTYAYSTMLAPVAYYKYVRTKLCNGTRC